MISNRTNLIRAAAVLAAVGLTLSACGSDETSSGGSLPADSATSTTSTTDPALAGGESGSDDSVPEPAPEPEPVVDTEPEPDPVPEAEPEPTPSGGDCLVGNWKISDAEMNSFYDALVSNISGADLSIDTSGEVLLTLTETTYEYIGDFDLTVDVVGQTGTGVSTGTVEGSWSADGEVIRTELGSSNLNIMVTVGGVTRDGSAMGNGFLQADPINNAPYSCDGPTIMFQAGATEDIRHPVVLTPA